MDVEQQENRGHVGARIAAFIGLVAVAGLALPLSAFVVEAVATRAENWVMVVYVVVMAALGAALGVAIRPLTPPRVSRRRGALIWGGLGMLAAVCGAVIWLVLFAG